MLTDASSFAERGRGQTETSETGKATLTWGRETSKMGEGVSKMGRETSKMWGANHLVAEDGKC